MTDQEWIEIQASSFPPPNPHESVEDAADRLAARFIVNRTRYPVDGRVHRELVRVYIEKHGS